MERIPAAEGRAGFFILKRIAALAGELQRAHLQPQIAACRARLHSRVVLPIGVVPLTAVVTRLRYGKRERAEVQFLDGTTKAVPLDEIAAYVGENENPNNAKQVAVVES